MGEVARGLVGGAVRRTLVIDLFHTRRISRREGEKRRRD